MFYLIFTLIIQFLISFLVVCFKNKWFWKWVLISNIFVHNLSLLYLIFFNKLHIGYQYLYSIKINFLVKNYILLFGCDGISIIFIWLTILIITLCILLSKNREFKQNEYLLLLLFTQFSIVIIFSTLDLIIFFLFFEIVLLPMYLLILKWGPTTRRPLAGYYFFIYTFVGSILMLVGIWSIIMECGTSSILVLESYSFEYYKQLILWFLFFWSFAIKIPIFPFHIWLPEAHVEAPTEGSIILAALLLKLGSYGFIRILINFFPYGSSFFAPIISVFVISGIIYSSYMAVAQDDLKKIIAYSSISHMGTLTIGIFSNNAYGIAGALTMMIAHAFVSSGLFGIVGFLYDRYHTRQVEYFSGFVQGMPLFSFFYFLLSLGNFGFPGTQSFIGETLLMISFAQYNYIILPLVSIGSYYSLVYTIMPYSTIVYGNAKEFINKMKDLNLIEFNFLFCVSFFSVFFGLFPNIFLDIFYISLKYYLVKGNDLC